LSPNISASEGLYSLPCASIRGYFGYFHFLVLVDITQFTVLGGVGFVLGCACGRLQCPESLLQTVSASERR
jgi:hypothetical protein